MATAATLAPTAAHQPDISDVKICFLADLPRYKKEKPIVFVPPAKPKPDDGSYRQPNVKRDFREDVKVENVRAWKNELSLDNQGFEVVEHETKYAALDSVEVCDSYREENQELLKQHLNAEKVITWGLRKRMPKERQENESWDYRNPVEVEQPAVMAHCDFTYDRGLAMVETFLGKEELEKYTKDGYRVRVINTWRPLVPVVERQPLALCDRNTAKPEDLVACDRVLIDDVGEMTLLQHRPEQKWYWLESQTTSEPFIFATWDSSKPGVSKHCPHVSFDSDKIRADAPPRFSVETRSIVVTKD